MDDFVIVAVKYANAYSFSFHYLFYICVHGTKKDI